MVNANASNVARLSRKLQKIGVIQAIACWHGPCQKGSERNGVIEKGGIGAGAGALLGGAMGGKKGAILGAIIGGGGAAVYTYGIRDKDHRRY